MKRPDKRIVGRKALFLAVGLAFSLAAGTSFAKDDEAALEKLGAFKRTDAPPMKSVPQDPKYAENLKKVLQQIRLPEGFKIELFAIVPSARGMAVSPSSPMRWPRSSSRSKYWRARSSATSTRTSPSSATSGGRVRRRWPSRS